MKMSGWKYLLIMLPLLTVAACQDDLQDVTELPSSVNTDEASLYWRTRSLTAAQKQELNRNYGVGFSYDAINCGKCDYSAMRCQVLDLEALSNIGAFNSLRINQTRDSTSVSHSFSEYCHAMNFTTAVSGDVIVFSAGLRQVGSIAEYAQDTVIYFVNNRRYTQRDLGVSDVFSLEDEEYIPEECLTPSFRYAIEKLKRTPQSNTLVVDSFIDIFGSHVVTDATIGANLDLIIKTRKGLFKDYAQEKTISEMALNAFFVEQTTTTTTTEQAFAKQTLNESSIDLSVSGGDVSVFHSLLTQLSTDNADATADKLVEWERTFKDDEESNQGNMVLVDMTVSPIWDFIPDRSVALRVKARIQADVPTMLELYGNRNWVNTKLKIDPGAFQNWWSSGSKAVTYNKASDAWVINVVASNRIVATICKEWIPEAPISGQARVVYPVYENSVDLTAGVCVHNGKVYKVQWLYDRFVVTELKGETCTDGCLYLTCGCLSTTATAGQSYQDANYLIGYEWPGSIDVTTGAVTGSNYLLTRKFLGNFYLENTTQYTNLPNWTYRSTTDDVKYYNSQLQNIAPFNASGISVSNSPTKSLGNRMVRNSDYLYYINTKELWYAK